MSLTAAAVRWTSLVRNELVELERFQIGQYSVGLLQVPCIADAQGGHAGRLYRRNTRLCVLDAEADGGVNAQRGCGALEDVRMGFGMRDPPRVADVVVQP